MTTEQLEQNKNDFLELLNTALIHRSGAKTELLISRLINSDFFTAPASTKYHNSYEGGLCEHCLKVYHNLKALIDLNGLTELISEDSIVVVSLLHDFSKREFYEIYLQNKKVYSDSGTKQDNVGRFDWVAVPGYKVKDSSERFIYGNHEETAEFMVRQFIPLTVEESVAILNHHATLNWDSSKGDISSIYSNYPLACLLHLADMMACYIINT